eukprot:6142144-Amphidinium_carterae.1
MVLIEPVPQHLRQSAQIVPGSPSLPTRHPNGSVNWILGAHRLSAKTLAGVPSLAPEGIPWAQAFKLGVLR